MSAGITFDAGGLIALDHDDRQVIVLLATSGTADIVDAHVVVCARRSAQQVVTTDPDDLRRLDPPRHRHGLARLPTGTDR